MFTSASFLVSEACNMACTYCFEKNRTNKAMTVDVARKGLEFLFGNATTGGRKEVSVILFGGEPLLNPKVCNEILSYGLKLSEFFGIPFKPHIITNATVLTDKIELMLYRQATKNPLFTCQLSIDGNKTAHDLYRVDKEGKGTFDAAVRNITTFRDVFGRRLSIHGCINKQTLPRLLDSYMYLQQYDASMWFMPVHTEEWSLEDVMLYDKHLGAIFEDMTGRGTVNGYRPIENLLPHPHGCEVMPNKSCAAGTDFCTITAVGDLHPCHSIYFNDESLKFGSVFNGITNPEKLGMFSASNSCTGCPNTQCYRCIADNYNTNGDIAKQVGKPIRCMLSTVERKWQEAARVYADEHFSKGSIETRVERNEKNLVELTEILIKGAEQSGA